MSTETNAEPRARRLDRLRANIGRRCRFQGEEVAGTIVGVQRGPGGWGFYVIEWDEGAPDWWTRSVSGAHGATFKVEDL